MLFYEKMGRVRTLNLVFAVGQYAAEGGRAPTIFPGNCTSIRIEYKPFSCSMSLLKMKT
jgi:hypothetical protein